MAPVATGSRGALQRAAPLHTSPKQHRRGCQARGTAAMVEAGQVAIRRRPPRGIDTQQVGPMDFQINTGDENKPRNILEEIVWHKAVEVEKFRNDTPLVRLKQLAAAAEPARDFRSTLRAKLAASGRPGLIAEVKKASPSRGIIQPNFDPIAIARAYEAGGAACLSVLTDSKFFQGSFDNLKAIRAAGVKCPLLCKEFIVDAYQIMKARASGADAILLIAAVLPNTDLEYFSKAAKALGMQCLIEVHSEAELQRVLEVKGVEDHILGINNRNLETFEVDLGLTKTIMGSPPGQEVLKREIVMIGESGIFTPAHVSYVQDTGCKGILVGESIVRGDDFEGAVKTLLAHEDL